MRLDSSFLPRATLLAAAIGSLLSACASDSGSDCALFCESWYDCSVTSGMDPFSGSCDFPGLTRDSFRALCTPKCDAVARDLTSEEREDAVQCLECMLGQVAPLECTNIGVGDAAQGPCAGLCNLPGPNRVLDDMFSDPEISAACL